jgi:antibiotic biosynthesis monooxygenase (ABM) superfamily enzyme
MPTLSKPDQRAKALADFQEAINDQDTLLADPPGHVERLTQQARQSEAQGVIDAEDLRELLEWVDSALAWAEEHLLSVEPSHG